MSGTPALAAASAAKEPLGGVERRVGGARCCSCCCCAPGRPASTCDGPTHGLGRSRLPRTLPPPPVGPGSEARDCLWSCAPVRACACEVRGSVRYTSITAAAAHAAARGAARTAPSMHSRVLPAPPLPLPPLPSVAPAARKGVHDVRESVGEQGTSTRHAGQPAGSGSRGQPRTSSSQCVQSSCTSTSCKGGEQSGRAARDSIRAGALRRGGGAC